MGLAGVAFRGDMYIEVDGVGVGEWPLGGLLALCPLAGFHGKAEASCFA